MQHFINAKGELPSKLSNRLYPNKSFNKTSNLEDFFLMANLRQKTTGLPMVIWVSESGHTKHGARIKVSINHSDKINVDETVSVSIAEPPEIMAGQCLSNRDLQLLTAFIRLNRQLLLKYWNSEIDTAELITDLQKIPTEN